MIYTKTGDKGTTSLVGGQRVSKYSLRVESYGTTDELNSYLGLIRDLIIDEEIKKNKTQNEANKNEYAVFLLKIINTIFNLQAIIACNDKTILPHLAALTPEDISQIETNIDKLESSLPKVKQFILPTGYYLSSQINIARAICRRAERLLCRLNDDLNQDPREEMIDEKILIFFNRLSDYLFLLSRQIMKENNKEEVYWQK